MLLSEWLCVGAELAFCSYFLLKFLQCSLVDVLKLVFKPHIMVPEKKLKDPALLFCLVFFVDQLAKPLYEVQSRLVPDISVIILLLHLYRVS